MLPLFALVSVAFAGAPNEIRYTGRLKSYQTVVNGTVSMTFRFYYQETGGDPACTIGPVDVKVSSGIFNYGLKPNTVDWSKEEVWLETSIGTTAMRPRERMVSQPYALSAGNGVPAGTVIAYAGNNVPDGYLLCDGRPVSASQYPALFRAIGTTYGGNSSAFNLPDFRGMFLRGEGTYKATPGNPNHYESHPAYSTSTIYRSATLGTLQGDTIRNITGVVNGMPNGQMGTSGVFFRTTAVGNGNVTPGVGNSDLNFEASRVVPTANENRPANYAVKYCIKY